MSELAIPSSRKKPPELVVLWWCPQCGRNDRFGAFYGSSGNHHTAGKRCDGKPIELHYRFDGRFA